jgi:hypothetical protein
LQYPITKLPARLVEAADGVGSDNAVSAQPTLLLKCANCDIAVVIEHITVIGVAKES